MTEHREVKAGAGPYGGVVFAGMVMLLAGAMQVLQGVVALVNEEFYVPAQEYVFNLNLTAWGWVHLLLGAAVAVTGAFVLKGSRWAGWAAIVLAAFSMIANIVWLPYFPGWSITVIVFDAFVLWAVTTHGRSSGSEG